MQFTPQQLVGAGRYAPSTRIGNWNEDLMLEEARMKEFILRKAQGELLRYDEPFLLMCNEALLTDDKSVLLKPPLFLKSGLKSERSMSPITYKQRVWLSAEADSVVAGDRIAVVHKMTGQALLASSGNKQPTEFGVEYEVSAQSVRGAGKRHHLVGEIEGTRTPDTVGHSNVSVNVWTFLLAQSAHEAQDDRALPQFASAASVIDVLKRCLAADSLYTFRGLLAVLTRADTKGTGHLNHEEIKWVIRQQYSGLPLRDEHLDLLFDSFDKRRTGFFALADLLKALRVPNENAEISRRDFIEVYSDISTVVAHDSHFEQLLTESWR
eukprot:jgi/Phyca11/13559/fgenesh1_pg.PHYCAscaffold_4_\